ncbi:MAG TPA: Maf family protein [Bryobacteraceae bacterium]|jgi:septum formation protein|nr:Maf family protein [Bryobacteraceae bacterium]
MLVLASRSPRRREILQQAGIPFVVRPIEVDEKPFTGEDARDYVTRIAREKANAAGLMADGEVVLTADTTVAIHGEILAKPLDTADARRMLRLLSGQRHEVLTGICLRSASRAIEDCAETSVWFAPLSPREIEDYAASGEPMDKAGAYAIQGLASKFIQRIEGCYFNVVGLPVAMVYRHLRKM